MKRNADTLNSSGTSGTTYVYNNECMYIHTKDIILRIIIMKLYYKSKVIDESIANGGSKAFIESGTEQSCIVVIRS